MTSARSPGGGAATAKEIAEATNRTARRVRLQATAEDWPYEARRGPGSPQRYYHLDGVSGDERDAVVVLRIKKGELPFSAAAKRRPQARAGGRSVIGLGPKERLRIDAKVEILQALDSLRSTAGIGVTQARHVFAAAYNAGEIETPAWVRAARRSVSAPTLARWQDTVRTDGVAGLAGAYGNRKGSGIIDSEPQLRDFVVGMLLARPHATGVHVMRGLDADFAGSGLPAKRTVQSFLKAWKSDNATALQSIADPDAHKSRRQPAFGSASEDVKRLNQLWEMDSTPADVMLTDGRHQVIGVVDVYSRRAKLLVTKTSRAVAIATLLRRAILDWGVPERVKTDQGQDYTSQHFQRALTDLEIRHQICPPFTPEGKPFIERFFGTLTRDLFEILPGYVGHNVADRKALEARKSFAARLGEGADRLLGIELTAPQLQSYCDDWCEDLYEREPHRSLKGKSPFEVAAAWAHPIACVEDERALDILLAEAPGDGTRVVAKDGLRIDNTVYIAGALGALVGERVYVRYDPDDFGRVYAYGGDPVAFICIAEAPERTGISRRAVAAEAMRQRSEVDKNVRKEARRLKAQIKPHRIAERILAKARDDADGLVAFPAPASLHETPALTAATDAAAGRGPEMIAVLTDEQREDAGRLWDEISAGEADTAADIIELGSGDGRPTFADDREYARWLIEHPEQRDERDAAWLKDQLRRWNFRTLIEISDEEAKTLTEELSGTANDQAIGGQNA